VVDSHTHDKDRRLLHALGYAQELSRRMSGFSNFAISFTIISILSGTLTLYYAGINYGGPVEEAYGWPIVSFFVIIVGLGMAEIASKYPTAGGLYYWASKMGGASWGWFTGWFNLIGQIAITAGIDYGGALFADALLQLLWPGTFKGSAHEVIYVYAVILALHAVMNIFSVRLVAFLNDVSVWWHVAGVLIIVGFLIFKPSHHQSFGTVFGHTVNNSGWGHGWICLVLLLGLLQAQYTYTGYDASAHMSEETQNASRSAARGVIMSIVVSAVFGYILALGVTFAIQGSVNDTALAGTFAVKKVLLDSLGDTTAKVMLAIIVGAQFYCGMSSITSASRMMYAFSRDGAVPGHQIWRRLNRERVPYMAAIAIAVLAFLCAFPAYFGTSGYTAYVAVTSIATIGLYIAYAIPIFLRLRLGAAWEPGEWNLGSKYKIVGWTAVIWIAFIAILFILPTNPNGVPWHPDKFKWTLFNYAPLAVGGTMLLVGGWWVLSANKWFKGPIAQGTEEELARIEAQYEGRGAHGAAATSA
jgi:amino acid transporter